MLACGRGFLVAGAQAPAVHRFLFQQTDRFSCDQLPPGLRLGTEGLTQRPWRYLMTAVALTWMVLGISWSALAPLFGALFGATTALVYVLCRQLTGRLAAMGCAAALALSRIQLSNLPNLRDYAKAPFTIALMAILVALAVRPFNRRQVLWMSAGYGIIMGIGYGFRTDLLIDFPAFLLVVAFFLPGGIAANLPVRVAAIALCTGAFAVSAWPIISAIATGGGCQWHFLLLGLTDPFNDALGVRGGAYSWGRLYKDEYAWAMVAGYAGRFRPDLGYIEYCSHGYDVASGELLRRIVTMFPADMLTRAFASAGQILDLPFARIPWFPHAGTLLVSAFVVAVSSVNVRLALFAVFMVLYFAGYPAVQFLPRHYFVFEVITWAVLACAVDRGARFLFGAPGTRGRDPGEDTWWSAVRIRRAALCTALLALALFVPLTALRWYQQARVSTLLGSYAHAATTPWPSTTVAPGHFQLMDRADTHQPSEPEAVDALGRGAVRLLETQVAAGDCRPGTVLTFHYDERYRPTDLTEAVALEAGVDHGSATRLFEPVYSGFQGITVSDPSQACTPRFALVSDPGGMHLMLPVQLAPGWESQSQFQRMVR